MMNPFDNGYTNQKLRKQHRKNILLIIVLGVFMGVASVASVLLIARILFTVAGAL